VFRPRKDGRIPVLAGQRLIEFADPARVRQLLLAPNARAVRRRKGTLVEIQIAVHGDDSRVRPREGTAQSLVHRAETEENPRRVWALKKLVDVTAPPAE
jgi:hypothetical protein